MNRYYCILLVLLLIPFMQACQPGAPTEPAETVPDDGKFTICVAEAGAVADGVTLNTLILQQCIDSVAAQPEGGRLCFGPGRWLTGMLELRSGVELWLDKEAVLLGSTNPYDYPAPLDELSDATQLDNGRMALLCAHDATGITLAGSGTIDAQGRDLALNIDSLHNIGERIDPHYNTRRHYPNETARPKLFFFDHCRQIRVLGITAQYSAGWGLSFDNCQEVTLEHVKVRNRAFWNNDGMDFTDCRQVRIAHCDINSGDDALCLKSYDRQSCCDGFEIEDCDIMTSSNAVKLGTASQGGFRNISIRNIRVRDTYRSAVALECVDGGELCHIRVDSVQLTNTRNAIFLRIGQRHTDHPGRLYDVKISRVKGDICLFRPDQQYEQSGPDVGFFHNAFPAVIAGLPEARVDDVTIDDVELVYPGRATKGMGYVGLYRVKQVQENPAGYPEHTMFGELPAWGFYVRHASNIRFRNIRFSLADTDFRPAFVFDDVQGYSLTDTHLAPDQFFAIDSQEQ